MPETNDIEELPEGISPINLKLIVQYQRKEPRLMNKYQYIYIQKRFLLWRK